MCNPSILLTATANRDACEYAKMALAVWRSKPRAFAEFDDWLFASATPPPLSEVRAKAEGLIGKEALKSTLTGSWVDRQLKTDVALYQANLKSTGDGRLPQLMVGGVITHGAIDDQEELSKLLEQNLHLTDVEKTRKPPRP